MSGQIAMIFIITILGGGGGGLGHRRFIPEKMLALLGSCIDLGAKRRESR